MWRAFPHVRAATRAGRPGLTRSCWTGWPRRHRRPVGAPGRGGRARPRRPVCDHRHRHRVREIAGLPAAGRRGDLRGRRGRPPRGDGPLPLADEGPRRRPAARAPLPPSHARPGRHLRRRHPARRADVGPAARQLRADQPRHAAQVAPSRAYALVVVPPPPPVCGHRRGPRVSRRIRVPCRARPAPPAPLCARYRSSPTFILASATASSPRSPRPASPGWTWSRSTTTPRHAAPPRSRCGNRR